jgi:sigma-B regulation protein RsbU (phosphoserine phosphatase)
MHPGDIFLVGTDGLNDARNSQNQYFGYDRLQKMVEALAHLPAQEIAQTIVCTVSDFAERGRQVDDQTLIVLKCLA